LLSNSGLLSPEFVRSDFFGGFKRYQAKVTREAISVS